MLAARKHLIICPSDRPVNAASSVSGLAFLVCRRVRPQHQPALQERGGRGGSRKPHHLHHRLHPAGAGTRGSHLADQALQVKGQTVRPPPARVREAGLWKVWGRLQLCFHGVLQRAGQLLRRPFPGPAGRRRTPGEQRR